MAKKQKSGLYRTKIKVGVDENGKDIPKWVSGRTQAELERNKQKAREYYIDGASVDTNILFGEYIGNWFRIQRVPRVDDITKQGYRYLLNKHIIPHFSERQMRAIRSMEVQEWFNTYAGSSTSLINKLYSFIRSVFRDAVADGVLVRDVTAGLKKPRAKRSISRRALTASETRAILRTIQIHPAGALLAVLYYLGIRRGEALGLQWGDFDWDEEMVHIQRDIVCVKGKIVISDLKTEDSDRFILLPTPLVLILKPMIGDKDAWVFTAPRGGPIGQSTYKDIWLSLMQEAGLLKEKELTAYVQMKYKKGRKILPLSDLYIAVITAHYLRHNYITKLFYAGFDPVITMWMVGHASYETTVDIYTHLRKARFQKPPIDMEWVRELKKAAYKIHIPGRYDEAPDEKVAQELHNDNSDDD